MESLFNILSRRMPDEPPEIRAVKDYIREHYHENVGVQLHQNDIVIIVRSSALAGALRARSYQLQKLLGPAPKEATKRRFIFRVGTPE